MKNAMRWSVTTLATMAALVTLVGLGVRADEEKVTGDLKKMQGTWVRAGEDGPDLKFVFKDEALKADVDGAVYSSKIAVDSKAKPNPTIDLTITEGPGNSAGAVSKGIYKFDGEKLILCVTKPGGDKRPAEYQATEDESYLFTLKKDKK